MPTLLIESASNTDVVMQQFSPFNILAHMLLCHAQIDSQLWLKKKKKKKSALAVHDPQMKALLTPPPPAV